MYESYDATPLAGSPLIDAVPVMSSVTTDYFKKPRPAGIAADLGAIEVQAGGAKPADSIKPTATASVSGTSGMIMLSATASDNVGVTDVEFLVDGVLQGSDSNNPYSLTLDSTKLGNGTHTLVALAFDAAGNGGSSAPVSFSVNNTTAPPPTPTDTTAPTATASVSGSSGMITLSATASDNVGVARVDFLVDGVLQGSDTSSPYSVSLDSTKLSNGTRFLMVFAYDAAGNSANSTAVSFQINNGAADTTAPTVTSSVSGSSGTITLSATASDNVGVARVDFLVDGVLVGNDTSNPYSLGLNSTTLSNGAHSLVTKAYDAAGNAGTSASVSFNVNNTVVVDNSAVIVQMKAQLTSMEATLATMSSTNKSVKALKANVAALRTMIGQLK